MKRIAFCAALLCAVVSGPAAAGNAGLIWDAPVIASTEPPIDGYVVYRSDGQCSAGNAFNQVATLPANVTAYTDAGLPDWQWYCWHVTATRLGMESPPSNAVDKQIGVVAPPAPGNLRIDVTVTLNGVQKAKQTFALTIQ